MNSRRRPDLSLKTSDDIERIREAGHLLARVFDQIESEALNGRSTLDVDREIEENIRRYGARPAFQTVPGYAHSSCISINNEILHGIPHRKRRIRLGDLVKIDVGIVLGGYFADACRTFLAGGSSTPEREQLMKTSLKALDAAIDVMRPGNFTGDIGHAIESVARTHGYSVVTRYTGHGVGFHLHEYPPVPSVGRKGAGIKMPEGLVLALEPMLNAGSYGCRELEDGWTVVTVDGSDSAQFEDTVALTREGPLVCTRLY